MQNLVVIVSRIYCVPASLLKNSFPISNCISPLLTRMLLARIHTKYWALQQGWQIRARHSRCLCCTCHTRSLLARPEAHSLSARVNTVTPGFRSVETSRTSFSHFFRTASVTNGYRKVVQKSVDCYRSCLFVQIRPRAFSQLLGMPDPHAAGWWYAF